MIAFPYQTSREQFSSSVSQLTALEGAGAGFDQKSAQSRFDFYAPAFISDLAPGSLDLSPPISLPKSAAVAVPQQLEALPLLIRKPSSATLQSNGYMAISHQVPLKRKQSQIVATSGSVNVNTQSKSSSVPSDGKHGQHRAPAAQPFMRRLQSSPPTADNSRLEQFSQHQVLPQAHNGLATPSTPPKDTVLQHHQQQRTSIFAPAFENFNPNLSVESTLEAHLAMKQALLDQSTTGDEEIPHFCHSGRHSVSSYGQSPTTPRTVYAEDVGSTDQKFNLPLNGESDDGSDSVVESWINDYLRFDDEPDFSSRAMIPRLERTVSDVYQDDLFNNLSLSIPNAAPIQQNTSLLTPPRTYVTDLVNAANSARSLSPTQSASSAMTAICGGSPMSPMNSAIAAARIGFGSAAAERERHRAEAQAHALKQPEQLVEPKTISPKDSLKDYHESPEDSKLPLFPNGFDFTGTFMGDCQVDQVKLMSAPIDNGMMYALQPPMFEVQQPLSAFPILASSQARASLPFSRLPVPSLSEDSIHPSQQTFRRHTVVPTSSGDTTPDFFTGLISMESSISEDGGMDFSSHGSVTPPAPLAMATSTPTSRGMIKALSASPPTTKPVSSSADGGTYTCTYHGCTLRFETPQKLQAHKRDGHRNNQTVSALAAGLGGIGSGNLALRNSQAGPHRCDRRNPLTGKPCDAVFSRPYDLTRHEDTIHNARKQKVRCGYCEEEKTFSRSDALTRHMRVVHPKINFPGKYRRRVGSSG